MAKNTWKCWLHTFSFRKRINQSILNLACTRNECVFRNDCHVHPNSTLRWPENEWNGAIRHLSELILSNFFFYSLILPRVGTYIHSLVPWVWFATCGYYPYPLGLHNLFECPNTSGATVKFMGIFITWITKVLSMAWRKTVVTPLLTHGSYCSLVHWYIWPQW